MKTFWKEMPKKVFFCLSDGIATDFSLYFPIQHFYRYLH